MVDFDELVGRERYLLDVNSEYGSRNILDDGRKLLGEVGLWVIGFIDVVVFVIVLEWKYDFENSGELVEWYEKILYFR